MTTLAAAMLTPIGASAAGLTLNGYVDASYTYLSSAGVFNNIANDNANDGGCDPVGAFGTPCTVASRVYDREHNSFNLQSVSLMGDFDAGNGWGGFVQLDFGNDAAVNESSATYTIAEEFTIQEANIRYKTGSTTVTAGKFATLAGTEVIESKDNWNFSRSYLFGYTIPFTHTGVRVNVAPSSAFNFTVGVNNGWDQLNETPNRALINAAGTSGGHRAETGKTIELGVGFNPAPTVALAAAFYTGEEFSFFSTNASGRRDLLDLTGTFGPYGPVTFKANIDFGQQEDAAITSAAGNPPKDAEWLGIAGYVNFQINPKSRVAGRIEQLDDEDGFRTGVRAGGGLPIDFGGQKLTSVTVTFAHAPNSNVELRAEVRGDQSDVDDAFIKTDGSEQDTQTSVALEGIVKF
jgi:hypothetical protein